MGSDFQYQIPTIEFSINSWEVERGTEGWHGLCKRVREACENYGCFEIVYDKIPMQLRAETFSVIRQLFSLPLETKQKNLNPHPFHCYFGGYAKIPLYESFGLEDASNYDSLRSFTELMWPNGHDQFCHTVITIMKQLDELKDMIEMMILDSYGLGEKPDSFMACKALLRIMKYSAPPSGEYMQGLLPHTDKAWSNGRMHAVKHRAVMLGEKERYSLGGFAVPIEGTIIKAPKKLVDEEHPQILKDFDYMDFSRFSFSEEGRAIDSAMQVFVFAGNST